MVYLKRFILVRICQYYHAFSGPTNSVYVRQNKLADNRVWRWIYPWY